MFPYAQPLMLDGGWPVIAIPGRTFPVPAGKDRDRPDRLHRGVADVLDLVRLVRLHVEEIAHAQPRFLAAAVHDRRLAFKEVELVLLGMRVHRGVAAWLELHEPHGLAGASVILGQGKFRGHARESFLVDPRDGNLGSMLADHVVPPAER